MERAQSRSSAGLLNKFVGGGSDSALAWLLNTFVECTSPDRSSALLLNTIVGAAGPESFTSRVWQYWWKAGIFKRPRIW